MAVETLRPNGVGFLSNLFQYPATGNHYDKVDEEGFNDGNFTYVYQGTESEGADRDLYELPNSAIGAGTITKVKVTMLAAKFDVEGD